jgi:hypothetical protein
MNRFLNWWRAFWTSKRTALLEAENERLLSSLEALLAENAGLRKNNEALINTALCEAGKPSLPGSEVTKPPANIMRRLTTHQRQRHGIITQMRDGLNMARYLSQKAEQKIKAEGTNGRSV